MTETERAIAYLQPIADSASSKMQYGKMLNIAIQALRDQLERENIVRCGECRHSQQGTIYPACLYCYNPKFNGNGFRVETDGFCAFGKRKEKGE